MPLARIWSSPTKVANLKTSSLASCSMKCFSYSTVGKNLGENCFGGSGRQTMFRLSNQMVDFLVSVEKAAALNEMYLIESDQVRL